MMKSQFKSSLFLQKAELLVTGVAVFCHFGAFVCNSFRKFMVGFALTAFYTKH